jgi:Ran GTPase-activating protein (RanGAP) involved in mRNA processing and transport
MGLPRVLKALAHRPSLTKLILRQCALGRDEVRQLRTVLRNTPSLQSLDLERNFLGSRGLAEVAPALHHNTSIKELNLSENSLSDVDSAGIPGKILLHNKTLTTLNLFANGFGRTTGAVEYIANK